jgi:hypothetical protein
LKPISVYPHTSEVIGGMFSYAGCRAISSKTRKTPNGMVVADPHGDCFCTNETWAWLTKGGRRNALDDICNSFGAVVTRRSK